MKAINLIAAAQLLAPASAFWRMECRGRLGLARIDPMISPGEVAQHVHAIHGSSGMSILSFLSTPRESQLLDMEVLLPKKKIS